MPTYFIADVEVTDQTLYDEYRSKVLATIDAYGGKFLARGGTIEVLEGTWSPKRCIIIEFPTIDKFRAWWNSEEYTPLKELRNRASISNIIVTEGN